MGVVLLKSYPIYESFSNAWEQDWNDPEVVALTVVNKEEFVKDGLY